LHLEGIGLAFIEELSYAFPTDRARLYLCEKEISYILILAYKYMVAIRELAKGVI